MKRIYISLLFLIIMICCGSAELGYIAAKTDNITYMINQIDTFVDKSDFDKAIELCKNVEKEWSENGKSMDVLLIHDYVDNVGVNIEKMRVYIENEKIDMYFSESAVAKKELASIKESEYPYFENIF